MPDAKSKASVPSTGALLEIGSIKVYADSTVSFFSHRILLLQMIGKIREKFPYCK